VTASSSDDGRLLHTNDEDLSGGKEWHEALSAWRKDGGDGGGLLPGMGWWLQAVVRRFDDGKQWRWLETGEEERWRSTGLATTEER
jgi:hypothetical protein